MAQLDMNNFAVDFTEDKSIRTAENYGLALSEPEA